MANKNCIDLYGCNYNQTKNVIKVKMKICCLKKPNGF